MLSFKEERNKMDNLLPKPREMDFNSSNLAATWKKWMHGVLPDCYDERKD